MKEVFIIADNIFSPLGTTTSENFFNLLNDMSSVRQHHDLAIASEPFFASLFDKDALTIEGVNNDQYTRFERLLIASISRVLKDSGINVGDQRTLLIISTTKGNISLLETEEHNAALKKRIALHTSAKLVAEHFKFINEPLIVSNACISGSLGILVGMRLIKTGQYDNIVVSGADVISKFVLSGFQALQALSNGICKPFDADRDGINLGEAAATVVLSNRRTDKDIMVVSGAVSNDANHISGPSRTGKELYNCIAQAMQAAQLSAEQIDFISAHATATIYNDEMEAKAISLAGLERVPVNSLKGFYGHTLGAAGTVESVVSIESLKQNILLPTKGFRVHGVSKPIHVYNKTIQQPFKNCIKTASCFGGCNAAIIFSKQ